MQAAANAARIAWGLQMSLIRSRGSARVGAGIALRELLAGDKPIDKGSLPKPIRRQRRRCVAFGFSAIVTATVAGCGTYVPEKNLFHADVIDERNRMSWEGKVESNIIANIRCEVTKGVYQAMSTGKVPWLAGWGAVISLNLTWDEISNLNPSLTYSVPIAGPSLFSMSGGLSESAHATRLESITFTWENKTLLREALLTRKALSTLDCSVLEDGTTVNSDLKIDQFIYDKASVASGHEATTRSIDYPQFSTFQETITFVVSFGGNVTPGLKLKRVAVNPTGVLASATRTETSQIIVTLGPIAKPASPAGPAELAVQAQVQHDAAYTAGATAAAIQGQSR